MKKILFTLAFIFAFTKASIAQDIDKLIEELVKIEGVEHQVIDGAMISGAIANSKRIDPDGVASKKIKDFMLKLEEVEVVALENPSEEVSAIFTAEFTNPKDGNGYETLLTEKDRGYNIRIMVQKNKKQVLAVFILVMGEEGIAISKMKGNFSTQDLTDIVNEQKQKN